MNATIETGRWYDIKIEIRGNSVKGYLDGQLVQEVVETRANVRSLCASASRDDKSGDVILKVVNTAAEPLKTKKGAGTISGGVGAIVLTSESPLDENTLEEPTKVSPKTEVVKISGTTLTRPFPGNSFTVICFASSNGKE
jgi:alpha-L-arabinofuranosidase